ncbi:MAG: bifunctional riboflavin kinase/FAD synthetase [Candidatus Firestonebacteria bacterium]
MIVLKGLGSSYLRRLKDTVITLGVFDGVHLGHQKIIKKLVKETKPCTFWCVGKSVVLTFEAHPMKTTHNSAPLNLTTLTQKEKIIKGFGIDILIIINFNKKFARISAKNFIEKILIKKLKIKKIIVGFDYCFGRDKEGNVEFLKKESKKYNFKVDIVKPVKVSNVVVSSTNIRKFIVNGNLNMAKRMLGRSYSVIGKVVKGEERGRILGFPTANIKVFNESIPLKGVYIVNIKIDSKIYHGICNISKPSFDILDERNLIPEVYIFDFKRNIYNKIVEVTFLKKIRNSIYFDNADELIKRINKDIKRGRSYF